MSRDLHHVSAKIAIYSPDYTKVLLTEYLPGEYGLPGGHLDTGESPEQAILRELVEELSITLTPTDLTPRDFWRHPNGKIILGYTATLPEDTPIAIDPVEIRSVRWAGIKDIRSSKVTAGTYDSFILFNA